MSDYVGILEESLGKKFDISNYCGFIVNFLNGSILKEATQMRSADYLAEYSFYIKGYALVAEYKDPQRKKIGIFAIKLNNGRDIEKARSKQRSFVAKLLAENNFDAAIAAFYTDDDTKWRLSFVRMDYEFVKGKVAQNLTPAKRYSYLVGEGEPCHTAKESLLPIFIEEHFTPTIDAIEQAFSVEKVTKQFYEQYREKYIELKEYLEGIEYFNEEAKRKGFTSEQFSKKFLGQLVFLYFLQKKGWLGVKILPSRITEVEYKNILNFNAITRTTIPKIYGRVTDNYYKINEIEVKLLTAKETETLAKLIKGNPWGTGCRSFVRDLFEEANKNGVNFFDNYLEPLFYEALNKKRDADNYYARFNCRIPFLNGGLFEPLDNYDWESDSFSIPNKMFSNKDEKGTRDADGILDIFDRYNFTINEDEPLEKEVAVDPEMLGKILENLLDVKDKKSKGAYYTPREIVKYMCQESLIQYIVNCVSTPYEDTCDFVIYGEIMKDEDCHVEGHERSSNLLIPQIIYNKLKQVDDALDKITVVDPAVGSGAFPVCMLSEIIRIREIITEYLAFDMAYLPEYIGWNKDERIASKLNAARWRYRHEKRDSYSLKKEIIRKSIFAIDIEPSAVDIAKLRLWIALVVEQEIDENDPSKCSPIPLPNLDFNLLCGDSLIHKREGVDFKLDNFIYGRNDNQPNLWSNDIDIDFEKLSVLQKEYYYTNTQDRKDDLMLRINSIKNKIVSMISSQSVVEYNEGIYGLTSRQASSCFLWNLHFNEVFQEKGGFDIVIGNPPYVQLQKCVSEHGSEKIGDKYKNCGYKTFHKTGDMYCLFYELGISILRQGGLLSFITSNKWLRTKYGTELRSIISNETNPKVLIDFSGVKVFDAVGVNVGIVITEKSKNTGKTIACDMNNFCKKDIREYLTMNGAIQSFYDSSIWNISTNYDDKIKSKILQVGKPLTEWEININYGIKTGLNEVFVIDDKTKNTLCKEDPKSINLLKPVLKGRDINKWECKHNGLWLIVTHNGIAKKHVAPVNIDNYKAIKKYLSTYYEKLKKRSDQGSTPFHLRDCAYLDDFDTRKIIFQEMVQEPSFAFDSSGTYMCLDTARIVTGEHLEYLTALFNSDIFFFSVKHFYGGGKLGANGVRMKHTFFMKFSAYVPTEVEENHIKQMVLSGNKNIDEEINDFFFDKYKIAEEERQYIIHDIRQGALK